MTDRATFQSLGPVELRGTDTYRARSRLADAEYEIRVAQPIPAVTGGPEVPPRLLYVTDGDLYFGMATDITRIMHQLFRELPPLLVVGIGYGTNDPRLQGEIRTRDLTPSEDPGFEDMARRMSPEWVPVLPEGRRAGRAEPFLDFMHHELEPFLRDRYDLAEERGSLFGSSLGGLFATWALLRRRSWFSRYVIVSPALWWDGETLFREAGTSDANRDDLPARVYLAAGEREEGAGIPGLDRWKLITNTRRMAEVLGGCSFRSLLVTFEVLRGETHTSAATVGLVRGLRAVSGAASEPGP